MAIKDWKKSPNRDVWNNKKINQSINITQDSSKRYFVTAWNTNRLGNPIHPPIISTDPLNTYNLARKKVKTYIRRN